MDAARSRRVEAHRDRSHALSLLAPLLLLIAACRGTYEARFDEVQRAYYSGDLEQAEDLLRSRIRHDEGGADADLLRLELAQVLQAGEHYAEASVLLAGVDDRLLVLDYSDAPVDELSRVLYSPDRARWHATPPERLMLNVQNMLNFLAQGEWEDAAVEARRARQQLIREQVPADDRYGSRFVWGLAGICLELAGAEGEAQDCYRDAQTPELERRPGVDEGSLLVVVQDGQAPVRVPALAYLYAYGAPRRLQLPALAPRSRGSPRVDLLVDGASAGPLPELLDYGGQSLRRYDDEFPRLLAAAALQAVPRAFIADYVERGLRDHDEPSGSPQNTWARFGGFLAGELVAEALPADTRCWTLLPANVRATRISLPAGTHTVAVTLSGPAGAERRSEWTVQLDPGGFALVQLAGAVGAGWAPAVSPLARDLTATTAGQQALELLPRPPMSTP